MSLCWRWSVSAEREERFVAASQWRSSGVQVSGAAMQESAKIWSDSCQTHEAYQFLRWPRLPTSHQEEVLGEVQGLTALPSILNWWDRYKDSI